MADVTGPIGSLPGSRHTAPDGAMCDDHPDRPAVARIQGETDSFGSEMHDCCQECVDAIRNYKDIGTCDYCKTTEVELRPHRDADEGMAGPVYRVCGPCIRKVNERLLEELKDCDGVHYRFDWDD